LAGAEDLVFGFGNIAQIREGSTVSVTKINAALIPYDNTRSVKDVLDLLVANAGIVL
jgi:hypothetical protein